MDRVNGRRAIVSRIRGRGLDLLSDALICCSFDNHITTNAELPEKRMDTSLVEKGFLSKALSHLLIWSCQITSPLRLKTVFYSFFCSLRDSQGTL